MYVVVLDEIDALITRNQGVLYKLFEWASANMENSNLILIGIANRVDLTDKFLPRLRSRKSEPENLIFEPYSPKSMVKLLNHRILEVYAHAFKSTSTSSISCSSDHDKENRGARKNFTRGKNVKKNIDAGLSQSFPSFFFFSLFSFFPLLQIPILHI